MPRLLHLIHSFTSGEWSPRLAGRVDLAKYPAALECLHNYLVLPQGGVTRRPGLRYVADVKTASDGCVRLLRMEPTAVSAYVIEAGCLYFRFYKNNARLKDSGGDPVEVTTPYTAADLFDIQAIPSLDVLYLLHPNYQTRKLERYADDCWKLRTVAFSPPPSIEFGTRPRADFSPGALSGDNVTVTAFNFDAFLAADVGREILVTAGDNSGARAGIASVTSAKVAVVNVCVPFVSLGVTCNLLWRITASPFTGVTPSAHVAVGKSGVTLTADVAAWRGGVNGYSTDGDCGKFVLLNGGCFEISCVNSSTIATTTIRGNATPDTAAKAESGNWTLEEALYSTCNGFAETGTFHDGRLYLAAGHRFAGSKTGDFENFAAGAEDDDSVLFALDSETLETIRWMRGQKNLLIGSLSSEWQAIGSTDAPITASNIQVQKETGWGSSRVPPVHVGPALLFTGRGGRQLRELAFVFETDGFQAPDLLLLAEHLTRRSTPTGADPIIVDLAYQKRPDSRLWAVRSDGVLLCCTYLREQNIIAWSRVTTPGFVESIAVIPHPQGDRDQVWVSVRRAITGVAEVTTPSDPFDKVVLLMHFEGSAGETPELLTGGFIDSTGRHAEGFATGAPIALSDTQIKFGATSLASGSNVYLALADHADWDFSSNDFTIECFVFFDSYPSAIGAINAASLWSQDDAQAVFAPVNFAIGNDGKLRLWASSNGTSWDLLNDQKGTNAVGLAAWHHLALTRQGSTFRFFIDGVLDATFSATGALFTSARFVNISRFQGQATSFNGYIDELRVTNGAAWYTGAFTPPTAAFALTGAVATAAASTVTERRYIEYFDDTGLSYPTLNLDAAYVCDSVIARTVFPGAGHLEGITVQVVADGAIRPPVTVANSEFTISPSAKKVEAGFLYTSDLTIMRPEIPIGGQSMMPVKLSWRRIVIKLLDTLGMQVGTASGEEIVPFRRGSHAMDAPPPLFTGEKSLPHLGWDDGKVIVRQTQPLPSTVIAILGVLDVGGG